MITGSVITRPQWIALEKSVSQIVGVLSPTQSDVVYLVYGLAIVALPFMILIGLIVAGQWKLLGAYATAGLSAIVLLSISGTGLSAPRWHFDFHDRLSTLPAQLLDDPRWIGMLAAVLTVSGPWLPARWRHWWWALLLAFVPIHLVISAIVPARSLVGLAVGWVIGALVVLVVGTPRSRCRWTPRCARWARPASSSRGSPWFARPGVARSFFRPMATIPAGRRWSSCTARINAAAARCASCGES